MTMIHDSSESAQTAAAKPVTAERQNAVEGGKGRKAGRTKSARQKANQSNRKPSRNFRLSPKAMKGLRANSGKGFVNPYRPLSTYHACVAGLRRLGTGRFHSFEKIIAAVVVEMGGAADAFKGKKSRSDATGQDWKGRILQNVKVLARRDYGAKLRQLGYEVRVKSDKGAGVFKV